MGHCQNWILNFPLMAQPLYVLSKTKNLTLLFGKIRVNLTLKALKESLINSPALGHTHYQLPFFLFVSEREGNRLGVLTQNMEPLTTDRVL